MEQSTCRRCGAAILWAVSEKGKRMPLDFKPEKRIVLRQNYEGEPRAYVENTYTSHFATCRVNRRGQ